jgi:hypothetical protein
MVLYHGTVQKFLASIMAEELKPGNRTHAQSPPESPAGHCAGTCQLELFWVLIGEDPSYVKFPAEGGDRSMCVSALGVSAVGAEKACVHLWAGRIRVTELVGGQSGELAEHVGCQFAVKE